MLQEYKIVLINSKVHHSLASSEYNRRRKECEEGLLILKEEMNIHSFRDIRKAEDLLAYKDKMGEEVYMRCLYVVEEIARTKKAAELLKENDMEGFGKLMFQTHEGLKNLYRVSCKELDFLVDCASANTRRGWRKAYGWGVWRLYNKHCKRRYAKKFLSETLSAYKKEFNIDAEVYEVNVVDGTHEE